MKQKKTFFILLAVMVVLIAVAAWGYNSYVGSMSPDSAVAEGQTQQEDRERTPAPDVTVYDAEGNALKLSDFRGKPVVMNFWTSWCAYCVHEMPGFQAKYEELGDEVHFLMINATDGRRETQEVAEEFLARNGFSFPVYYDLDMDAVSKFGVVAYPITFFIDAEGNVEGYVNGMTNSSVIQYGIDLVSGK